MSTLTIGGADLSFTGGNWTSAPSGTVVQSGITTASGGISSSSDGPNASGLIVTMSPRLPGSKFLTMLSGVCTHSNKTSSDNHGCIYYMYVSVASGSYANVAANMIGSHHINGDLGAWVDIPLTMTYLATPTYTIGDTVAFQPYYSRNTGGSGTQYFHHDGHSAAASQVYNLSVLEIAS